MNRNLTNLTSTHPGLIIAMVVGFVSWWPVGMLVLAYILWSNSMGRVNGQWIERAKDAIGLRSGNSAFDAHKAAKLQELEAERQLLEQQERDFRLYMDRVRMAKDQTDFNAFLREKNNG